MPSSASTVVQFARTARITLAAGTYTLVLPAAVGRKKAFLTLISPDAPDNLLLWAVPAIPVGPYLPEGFVIQFAKQKAGANFGTYQAVPPPPDVRMYPTSWVSDPVPTPVPSLVREYPEKIDALPFPPVVKMYPAEWDALEPGGDAIYSVVGLLWELDDYSCPLFIGNNSIDDLVVGITEWFQN